MSLQRNILANYASQIYLTLVGIAMVPLYIRYMGAEAYGLVGFFAMLQACFTLLDMGLTPTMARETARFHGGASDAVSYRRLVRALEGVFLLAAILAGTAVFAAAGYLAHDWLQASRLSVGEIRTSIRLMAVIVAMRGLGGLYRSTITGAEKLVWLGGFTSAIATLRFVAVLPVLMFVGATPTLFFGFQCGVALLELTGVSWYAYRQLPALSEGRLPPWDWTPLKPVLTFSMAIAFTSSLWVLVTQTDKLLLSRLLPLAEYGFFSLAVLVAGGVLVLSAPISGALLPRMARLNAECDEVGLLRVYRNATQLVAVVAISATAVLAVFAEQILWAWTGNRDMVRHAAPVLRCYALGNGISAIGTLCYYLQFAKGDLTLHVIETPLFLVVFLPALLWFTARYGSVGAGYAWLITHILFFLLWVPLVHRRFAKGLHALWLRDIGRIALVSSCAMAVGYLVVHDLLRWSLEGLTGILTISLLGLVTMGLAALASQGVRHIIQRQWSRYHDG